MVGAMQIVRTEDRSGKIRHGSRVGHEVWGIEGELFGNFRVTDEKLDPVRWLAPIAPPAIYGIGLNYRAHAEEVGIAIPDYPVVFMKSPTSVQDPGGPIVLPRFLASDRVDYECELAVVIGRRCKNLSVEEALDAVFGYMCANDVSARDWQKERGGGQWVKAKSFDTFCPLGPVLVTADRIPDPQILPIRTLLNGEVRQESYTGDMIFSVAELVAFLSGSTTLDPGTVILTGTPPGVGAASKPRRFLRPEDSVEVEITGIGSLRNPVEIEAPEGGSAQG